MQNLLRSCFTKWLLLAYVVICPLAADASVPRWVKHHPKSDNGTYRYVVESATAASEDAAYNKAMGLVIQHSIMSIGLPFSSKDVETAINTGKLHSMMAEWKIPVHMVCRFNQGLEGGGVRVYVLCQVAIAGNIDVQFTDFSNCGEIGEDVSGLVSMRPDNWALYEMETYFSAFEEMEMEDGMDAAAFKSHMETTVKQTLVDDLLLTDSTLIRMVKTKYHVHKQEGFAVAYIERKWVMDKYSDLIEEELDVCYSLLENADAYIAEGNTGEAKSLLIRTKEQIAAIEPKIIFMNAYAASRTVERFMEDSKDLKKRINDKMILTAGNSQKAKEDKIYEYIKTGQDVLTKHMIGDALRYFYAAQLLLADLPNNGHITIQEDGMPNKQNANLYLQNKITQILKKVQIVCDGYFPASETEIKLSFRYEDTPITNLNFSYNANTGWSDIYSVQNGWSAIFLPVANKPSTIHVRLEYRYEDEANFDAELPLLMDKYKSRFDYDSSAKSIVPVVNNTIEIAKTVTLAESKNSTDITQNYVANKVEELEHKVSTVDSTAYQAKIEKVCEAIKNQAYDSVFSLFTMDGYDQFERLIRYGKARVITLEGCRYVRLGEDVQCRSIPMSFSFSKGKQQLENVVFTFNNTGRIDGIQFALEERSARNIMGNTDIDELSRLTLVNFMENYKTAFALKRLDYIESIFSDNAVIITGRVLKPSEQNLEMKNAQFAMKDQTIFNNVVLTRMSKEQYMKRLKNSFSSKEWINIKFGSTTVDQSKQQDTYGIRLVQDYSSNNYGDHGFLFLLIDATEKDAPTIRVRTWQPETGGGQPFTMDDYDRLTSGSM